MAKGPNEAASFAGPASYSPGERGWLLGILLAAFALRVTLLGQIPALLIPDECDNLVNVFQILNGKGPGFFGLDWKPQPAASVYLLSFFMRLGDSVFALRLPSALLSVAALLPFHALLRRAVAAPAALLATGLLASDLWYLHFSRSGWENVHMCLFLLAAALAIREAVRTGDLRSYLVAGVCAAAGLYGYFAGRVILFCVLAFGLASLFRAGVDRRRIAVGLTVTCITAVVLFAPQLPVIIDNWPKFQQRSRVVFSFSRLDAPESLPAQVSAFAQAFVNKTYFLFAPTIPLTDEPIYRYLPVETFGAFSRPIALLLAAGMLLSLIYRGESLLWWVFFIVPFVLTEVVTTGSLNGARGVIFVPVLYLFVGLALDRLWVLTAGLHRFAPVTIAAGALLLAVMTVRQYFTWVGSPTYLSRLMPTVGIEEFETWKRYVKIRTIDGSFVNTHNWKTVRDELDADR